MHYHKSRTFTPRGEQSKEDYCRNCGFAFYEHYNGACPINEDLLAYPAFICRDPDACIDKGYCPRDPTCVD